MEFSRVTDVDTNNEINSGNNNKIYEPKELIDLLLKKTQQIANNYEEISLIGDIINFKIWKRAGCSIDLTMNVHKMSCRVWKSDGLQPINVEEHINSRCRME